MNHVNRLSKRVRELLFEENDWELVEGKKHFRLVVAGTMAALLPKRQKSEGVAGRAEKNVMAQIRRARRAASFQPTSDVSCAISHH